ncbi:Fasciclin-like arabinogalactan protein 1 [Castilleja foliolosa]|uniref:Fasciclin-like arabinogalactan protein 1 n=1 Tax=Castilleja foliolosa TaxID=1961234 RepID=A0ABD3BNS6_9LAMI
MQLSQLSAAATVALSLSLLFILLPSTTHAHNITRILAQHPDLSTFNHYLTVTQLAPEINRRETITVCAIDNAGMGDLLSKHPSTSSSTTSTLRSSIRSLTAPP